jgi:hypothetical protein
MASPRAARAVAASATSRIEPSSIHSSVVRDSIRSRSIVGSCGARGPRRDRTSADLRSASVRGSGRPTRSGRSVRSGRPRRTGRPSSRRGGRPPLPERPAPLRPDEGRRSSPSRSPRGGRLPLPDRLAAPPLEPDPPRLAPGRPDRAPPERPSDRPSDRPSERPPAPPPAGRREPGRPPLGRPPAGRGRRGRSSDIGLRCYALAQSKPLNRAENDEERHPEGWRSSWRKPAASYSPRGSLPKYHRR